MVCGMAAEAAIILLMIKGRVPRTFPAFFIYLCWSLFSDLFLYCVHVLYPPETFFRIYLIQFILDSLMIFALLVEVAWSVLRPIRNSLPKVFMGRDRCPGCNRRPHSVADRRPCRSARSLRCWNEPLPVAADPGNSSRRVLSGVGRIQPVALHRLARPRAPDCNWARLLFHRLSGGHDPSHSPDLRHAIVSDNGWVASFSYLAALAYWVYAFATQPAERREFTPQMQSMLLAVAGAARSTRVALDRFSF